MTSDTQTQAALPALAPGNTAVVTGAASGIGLAAARRLAAMGLNVVLADRQGDALSRAEQSVADTTGSKETLAVACDVSRIEDLLHLADAAYGRFGGVSVLMNNAGVGDNPGAPWENLDAWNRLIDINFWGVVHGVQAFAPRMIAAGQPGLIINTGSKQGITTPPGNLAYNVSKSALRSYTEGLEHALRNIAGSPVSAHLLIPGYTYTGITKKVTEKPAAAWTGEQVVDFMLESLARGDFYILCPDNDTSREVDERRMAWAIGDIIENRPALSRWHPDYSQAFQAYLKGNG